MKAKKITLYQTNFETIFKILSFLHRREKQKKNKQTKMQRQIQYKNINKKKTI